MQRLILRLKPEYRETWNELQQRLSEELPFKYFQTILPGATTYRSVYYRWHAEPGDSEKNWCETDGLLIYDDHLFIIEARAGAFTYTSPANDFPAFIASLKNLVLKPAMQGRRFLDYFASADKVELFDKDHNKVGELSTANFRHIIICPVTLDPFTEMQHKCSICGGLGSALALIQCGLCLSTTCACTRTFLRTRCSFFTTSINECALFNPKSYN